MTRISTGCLGLAVVCSSVLVLQQCSPETANAARPTPGSTYEVKRADLDIMLTENGTLVAKESVKLNFKIRGQGRITFLVKEGTEVAQDEVVCKLDTSDLKKRVEELELELLTAETGFNTAKTGLEIQKVENVAELEKAQSTLTKAQKELERYRDGDAPQDRRKLEIELKDAETTFNRAKKKYEDSQELIKDKYIKQTELEDHKIEFEKAKVTKEGAHLAIKIFDKYTYPMTMTEKELAVRDGERTLETTRKSSASKLEQKQVAVTQGEKRVAKLKTTIAEKKKDIENMTLESPVPGVVLYGDPREPWYSERIKIGADVWQGMTLMTIPDLRVMLVKLDVHEADINKVAVGQVAKITMDTYPGLVLDGKVSKVAQIASSNRWQRQSGVKKFPVEITIEDTRETKLKPGISAKAEIKIDRRPETLFVPLQCVFLEAGVHYCRVMEGGQPARREIVVGQSSDKYIEILEGVEVGTQVLLYNPNLPAGTETDDDKAKQTDAPAGETPSNQTNSTE